MELKMEIITGYDGEISEESASIGFAKGLKECRKFRKYSLTYVQEKTGIPNPTISRYENNKIIPSIIQIMKLASLYSISLEDILIIGLSKEEQREKIFADIEKNEERLKKYGLL